jgi:hypothetical protein
LLKLKATSGWFFVTVGSHMMDGSESIFGFWLLNARMGHKLPIVASMFTDYIAGGIDSQTCPLRNPDIRSRSLVVSLNGKSGAPDKDKGAFMNQATESKVLGPNEFVFNFAFCPDCEINTNCRQCLLGQLGLELAQNKQLDIATITAQFPERYGIPEKVVM